LYQVTADIHAAQLRAAARARPMSPALIVAGEGDAATHITYAELDAQVDALCHALAAHGVTAGAHVGVLLPNGVPFVVLIHALMRMGAVIVPLNLRLTDGEIAWQAARAECQTVIAARAVAAVPLLLWDVLAAQAPVATSYPDHLHTPDDLQAILFTSGTSGRPKGAQLTHGTQFWSAMASALRLGTLPQDRWLLTLPLYHVGGMGIVIRCCVYQTCVVLPADQDMTTLQAAMAAHDVTLVSLVPTQLYRWLEAGVALPPSLRLILLGGAAASADLVVRCPAPIATSYGLTEANSQVCTQLPADVRRKPASVGRPLPFCRVRVVDEQGAAVPSGAYGEVVVSGPTVMRGYYQHDDDRTLRAGELYTGDIGYLDDEGDLWLVQRRSDLIVSGGENVYPAEVEAVLRTHPAVADVCVVGVADAEWGQVVAAAVVLGQANADVQAMQQALAAHCRAQLAGYKVPRRWAWPAALPHTASGKVARADVRALFEG
jgi:o-succinylbenzoate---CoA ligase